MFLINNLIVNFVKIMPKSVVHIFARRYIAGEQLEDAVRVTGELNEKGIVATIDVLGESINNKKEAEAAKKECISVLEAINKNNLDANLSIKPTQLGLIIDKEFCLQQISEILDVAKSYNNFVRMDMEDSSVTASTLEVFTKLNKKYDNVGIVLQSYLRRTLNDVGQLKINNTNYRLCKGIYIEPENIAFKEREEVRKNFIQSLELMLDNGNYVGIATHDEYLINEAYRMIKEKNIPKNKFEFQMLYGVTEHLRDKINSDGYKIRIYIPYGEHWYPYSVRRLKENPQLAWYITKSIFSVK